MAKIKLRVLSEDETPENAKCRVLLSKDDGYQEWVRETCENAFLLWSNISGHRGDMVYDPVAKRKVEVDSPYEEVLDEEGYCTGKYKLKDGIIAFPVDMYEHSGTAWALSGEGGACFSCPWDTTQGAFILYCDQDRWEKLGGSAKWEFVDGKPSDALMEDARRIARNEVEQMNLCEQGSYYRWTEQHLTRESAMVVKELWNGEKKDECRVDEFWDADEECDSCGGILTEKPAEDCDFPVGMPVVTDCEYCEGDTFTQECWALVDDITGKYLATLDDKPKLTENANEARLFGNKGFPEMNRKWYEDDMHRALTVVDVTEKVWAAYPECVVKEG